MQIHRWAWILYQTIEISMIDKKDPSGKRSWKCAHELKHLIPPVRAFSVNGSIDRYGFTHILAALCGMSKPKRPFSEWIHGWIWDERPTPESLAVNNLRRSVPIIVRNNNECRSLFNAGFRKVVVGGLPFCYLEKQHDIQNEHALLAFPPHSAEVEHLNNSQTDYMDYLESLKKDFDGIYISVFFLDWGGALHKAAEARGLNVILGARPDDANSLIRTRSLLDAFSIVTSNTMGSHFVYALYAGCKFSFSGPMYQYDKEIFIGNGNLNNHSLVKVERLMEIQSELYLRSRFGHFFVDHPSDGSCDLHLGRLETGANNVLNENQIREAVGWTVAGQMRGYLRGTTNRVQRFLRSHNG